MKNFLAKAAVAAVVLSPLAIALPVHAETLGPITFEASTYSLGNINGQDGWIKTGSYDAEVESNTYSIVTFGNQVLRISNAITSGSFGDQTFSKPLANEAGETDALNGGMSGGTRQNHFEAEFDFASVMADEQPGLFMSVSPDRGDGARMSYLGFDDEPSGINVIFFDVQGTNNPANFVSTPIATNLSRTAPHTAKFVIDFVDGASNDVVNIYIDDVLVHTGTSWENYYRFDPESNPGLAQNNSRTVDSLLFRVSGAAASETAGEGFLIDNLSLSSSTPPPVSCPAGTTQSSLLETVSVNSASFATTPSIMNLTSGQNYLLVSSGTWTNSLNVADTEYASVDNWTTHMNGYDINPFFLGEGEFDLQVDGAFVNWGSYNTGHTYSSLYTGDGSPVDLGVFDGDSNTGVANAGWYGDNSGSLSVNIYSCDANEPPPSQTPTDKNACKNGGWETLVDDEGNGFKNQGDCISYVATKGKNEGAGD